MRRAGTRPGKIFTSPYLRARQTASAVAEALLGSGNRIVVMPELASGASWQRVSGVLLSQRKLDAALLVGHQPDLSEMAAEILGGGPLVSFAPATMACMQVDAIPPTRSAELLWCRRSEELARLRS